MFATVDMPIAVEPPPPRVWRVLASYLRPHWVALVLGGLLSLVLGATAFEDAGPGYVIPGGDDLGCLSGVGLGWVAASW